MTDEEKKVLIDKTILKLKAPKTGLSSLRNSISNTLTPEELLKLKNIKATKPYAEERFNLFVAKKIQEYEKGKKNPDLFREDVLQNVLKSIAEIENPQQDNIFIQEMDEYNNIREQLNAMPEVFMKYGFSSSCSNGAGAFVYEFIKELESNKNLTPEEIENIKKNDIKFLETTKYTNLIDGHVGHVVPIVKLSTGNWVMIEARNETFQENVFTKEIPGDNIKLGKSFEHLIKKHKDEPYIIRGISSENCTDHQEFLDKRSSVPLEEAKAFLAQVAKEEYWSPSRAKIERELKILSKLSEEDKKLPKEELQCKIERERRIKSLRLATEELGKQVQRGPYVSMDELKKAQEQRAYFGYGNLHD